MAPPYLNTEATAGVQPIRDYSTDSVTGPILLGRACPRKLPRKQPSLLCFGSVDPKDGSYFDTRGTTNIRDTVNFNCY